MTHSNAVPEILDILVMNVRETAFVARALLGAQGCHLHLGAELEWLRERLTAAEVPLSSVTFTSAAFADHSVVAQGVRNLPLPAGSPTDLLDVGVDIIGSGGGAVGMLQLEKVQAGWSTREHLAGLERVTTLLQRQFTALAFGPALVADPMLRLVGLVQELDEHSVSQALSGLLRVLSGQQPSRVEGMAMRICGLVDSSDSCLEDREIALSEVTQVLLDRAGIGRSALSMDFGPLPADTDLSAALSSPEALFPFARLRIIEQDFDVAEAEEGGRLWFRQSGTTADWMPLSNSSADGWTAIAAEILSETRDITSDFAKMHLIRRRDLPTDEIAEAYELGGVIWWLRSGEEGTEARLDGGDWRLCALEADLPAKGRALNALLQIDAEVIHLLADQAKDWSHRMAHSVQVSPVMSFAAE